MNDTPISLNHEIIKANHPLLVRDEGHRIDFEHRILSRYLDRRYYDKRWTAEFLKQVAESGIENVRKRESRQKDQEHEEIR